VQSASARCQLVGAGTGRFDASYLGHFEIYRLWALCLVGNHPQYETGTKLVYTNILRDIVRLYMYLQQCHAVKVLLHFPCLLLTNPTYYPLHAYSIVVITKRLGTLLYSQYGTYCWPTWHLLLALSEPCSSPRLHYRRPPKNQSQPTNCCLSGSWKTT
jgi:hypothetical protein